MPVSKPFNNLRGPVSMLTLLAFASAQLSAPSVLFAESALRQEPVS